MELLTTVVIVTVLIAGLLLGISYVGRRFGPGRAERDTGASEASSYFVRFFPDNDVGAS